MAIIIKQKNAHTCKVISGWAVPLIYDILSYPLTYRNKMGVLVNTRASYLDKRGGTFLCGLVPYVSSQLNKAGHEVEFHQLKFEGLRTGIPKLPDIKFEDYQKKALRVLSEKNNRGIILSSTGSGKSVIIGGIISKFKVPCSLVITPNKSIFGQLKDDLVKWFPEYSIGAMGDSTCELGHITVALYQSLSKWDLKNYNRLLDLILLDEGHMINNSIEKIISQLTGVHYRYALTATMPRVNEEFQKYVSITGNFGDVLTEITDKECSERVTDVEVYSLQTVITNTKGKNYQECYRKDVLLNQSRNRNILKAAQKTALDSGKTCLIMLKEIAHANALKKEAKAMGMDLTLVHSKNKDGFNDEVKELIEKNKKKLVAATGTWSVGTSIYNVDVVILASVRKSYFDIIQTIGRGRRRIKGKKDVAVIIDMFDVVIGKKRFHKLFYGYSETRKKMYEDRGWYKGKLKL